MLLRLNQEKIRPKAKFLASLLFYPHLLACVYCTLNVGMHFSTFLEVGMSDFDFFATYLTLVFAALGCLAYCLHIKGKASFSLAMLGCCQAALAGGGLIWLDRSSVVGNAALMLHGTSVFVLKYTLPFAVPGFRRK